MRIGVDIRHLSMAPGTGGSKLMVHALRALSKHDTANQYIPYNDKLGRWGSKGGPLKAMTAAFTADLLVKNIQLPFWARRNKLDALLYFLPPCSFAEWRIPQYCYILDIPEAEESRSLNEKIYNKLYIPWSGSRANHIITISHFSARQINQKLGVSLDDISVLYPCFDPEEYKSQENLDQVRAELARKGIPPGFVLGVLSRMQERKNPKAYLETYHRLPEALKQKCKLVLVGAPADLDAFKPFVDKQILKSVADHVFVLGRVSDRTLSGLYQSARALLFPSKYEGFGLPVIEALASNIDVVASNIPVIQEIAPPATRLHDPDDWDGMAQHLEQIITNPGETEQQRQVGLKWVEKFSYASYAQAVGSLWKGLN